MKILRGTNLYKDFLLIYKRIKLQKCDRIINSAFISKESCLGRGCRFENDVHIGKGSYIGDWSYLRDDSYLWPSSRIGKYCSIGERVSIGVPEHPIEFVSTSSVLYHHKDIDELELWPEDDILKPAIIGNDVWIGNNAVVMQGVKIGDGAVVGAGAIVSHDVNPYSVVCGCPAREIKKRFSIEIINKLLEIKWWNIEYEKLKKVLCVQHDVEKFIKEVEKI